MMLSDRSGQRVDLERLREALGDAEVQWLVERMRRRLEQGDPIRGTVTLRRPTPEQREAVDRLLGRRPTRGAALQVDLERLEQVLRHAEICDSLVEVVETLFGPVTDVRARAEVIRSRWDRLAAETRARLARRPEALPWLEQILESGHLRLVSRGEPEAGRQLLDQALVVIDHLPARGVPLPVLAAQTTGDSHGLDHDRALGRLLVRAAAVIGGGGHWERARGRREAWASVGVTCDELSAPVLVLGLAADGSGLSDEVLRLHAASGEPVRLTLGQLVRHPPRFRGSVAGRRIFVCENPSVVAAAAFALGRASSPLVATEGQPSTAVQMLLDRLCAAGACLAFHGDFDWPGVSIANLIIRRHAAVPWRFEHSDYLQAGVGADGGKAVLAGTPVEAGWDPELAPVMIREGRAVHEEQVLEELLADLDSGPAGG